MRVLLLNPPFREGVIRDNFCCHTAKADYIWAPSDLLYVSGLLRGDAFEVAALDAVVEPKSWDEILTWCRGFRPDVIIALTSSASYASDLAGLEKLKGETAARVFVMGNLVAFEPRRVLERWEWLDGVLHNMLDVRVADLLLGRRESVGTVSLRRPDGSLSLGDVNGIDRRDCPLDVPAPQHHLFPNARYSTPLALRHPQTSVLTATGCPYNCSFCIYSPLKLFERSMKSLSDEFASCRENDITELYVVDPTFNADLPYMRKICDLMIRERFELSWACRIHPRRVALDDLQLLREAGCHTVQIGVESANEATLDAIAPTKNDPEIRRAFELAHRAGLRTLGYFIIGYPGEDREQTLRTIDYAIELDPFFASFSHYMPLNGTRSHESALDAEHIDADLQVFDLNGSPVELRGAALSAAEREELVRLAYRRFYVRPRQAFKYLRDLRHVPLYVRNGLHVIRNQF